MMNVSDVVIDMKAMLERAEPEITDECCIYRVPHAVRKANPDAYTPRYVSIGPYHHRTLPQLISMERHKVLFFKAFLLRTETTLETLIHYLEEIEPVIRRCYSETLELTKEELVKVILVDSCFILEHFLWSISNPGLAYDYAILMKPWLYCSISIDLMLLENQIPFFVLEGIFNLCISIPTSASPNPFLVIVFNYFSPYNTSKLEASDNITIRHFTDLIRIFNLQHPLQRRPERKEGMPKYIPSATQLMEAGLRFKGNTKSDQCLLDLRFSGRVLEIPQLRVDLYVTEMLFRNMIALEQYLYPYESYISDYVTTMDFLINTGSDVDILEKQGVLDNWLGDSKSVANMFNNLLNNIVLTNFSSDYCTLCEELNNFCRDPWRQSIATLRRDYCNTPWKTAASIAGVILLILSLIQTVCSVLQVV